MTLIKPLLSMESSSTSASWESCLENMHKLFNKNFKQYTPLARFPRCALYLYPQILHNPCFSFLLGITAVPREIENNAYVKLRRGGGGK